MANSAENMGINQKETLPSKTQRLKERTKIIIIITEQFKMCSNKCKKKVLRKNEVSAMRGIRMSLEKTLEMMT